MSIAQDRVEDPFMHDVSAGSAGGATEVICGVDPRSQANRLGAPPSPRRLRMAAVQLRMRCGRNPLPSRAGSDRH